MSTREQAILFWVVVLLVVIIFGRKKNLLDSLKDIIKCTIKFLLNPIAIVIILINLSYLLVIYYFSYKNNLQISLWYIKDYLIVLFFSVFPIVEHLKNLSFKEIFHDKKTELFGLAAIPLFINSSYTFPLVGEIILMLILTILIIIIGFAELEEDTKIVAKVFNFILISISLFMIISSMIQFINNIRDVLTINFWLDFGIEGFVWLINIPVIYLAKKMMMIEKKVIFSNNKNNVFSYVKFYLKLLVYKFKFYKYKKVDFENWNLAIEGEEFSAVGGNRIYIKVNRNDLSNEILIALASDAILGRNKYTKIVNRREKYPNVVEIVDEKLNLYVFWQDDFIKVKWQDKRCDNIETTQLVGGIKIIN